MLYKLDTAISVPFSTRDLAGNRKDADALPTATVELNGTDVAGTDIAVVKKLATTGQYYVTLTLATAQFVVGNIYSIRVTAIVDGTTDEDAIKDFEVSAGSHGKVIGTGVPEIGAGQPNGLFRVGVNDGSIQINASTSYAMQLNATANGHAMQLVGSGSGSGLRVSGGATGDGITSLGGATSGHGINAFASLSGSGVRIVGVGAAGLHLQSNNDACFKIISSTSGVDGIQITTIGAGRDIAGDIVGSVDSVADPSSIWSYTEAIAGGWDAFEIICMAAAGVGANALTSVQQPGNTPLTFDTADYREETFTYPDGVTAAFTIEADHQGLRRNLSLP